MSGAVVKCCREKSHYVAVHMLPSECSGYVPLILAKDTLNSIYRRDEAEEWITGTCWQI